MRTRSPSATRPGGAGVFLVPIVFVRKRSGQIGFEVRHAAEVLPNRGALRTETARPPAAMFAIVGCRAKHAPRGALERQRAFEKHAFLPNGVTAGWHGAWLCR
jgi:hypothetical protein